MVPPSGKTKRKALNCQCVKLGERKQVKKVYATSNVMAEAHSASQVDSTKYPKKNQD